MKILSALTKWFVYSSKDPQKISLTLKAGLPLLAFVGVDKYLSGADLSGLIDAFATTIAAVGTLITAGMTLFGFVRKIRSTASGPTE